MYALHTIPIRTHGWSREEGEPEEGVCWGAGGICMASLSGGKLCLCEKDTRLALTRAHTQDTHARRTPHAHIPAHEPQFALLVCPLEPCARPPAPRLINPQKVR